jgi:TRAP-type mannitol/chloroaromatic compound transport system permease large subunit
MRFEDINVFTTTDKEGALSGYSVIDISNDNKINAGLSIIRTLFVCTLMAVSGFVFAADVNTLILVPIDRMLKKVDRIA